MRCWASSASSTWASRTPAASAPTCSAWNCSGPRVQPVDAGARTLKEATSAAIRDWVTNVESTHYVIGSVVGPAPYPALVRDLQRVIGDEARAQILEREGRLPRAGRSPASAAAPTRSGIFAAFIDDEQVELVGVEAAGEGIDTPRHGAPLTVGGRPGILHGSRSAVMQDEEGQIIAGPLDLRRPGLSRRRAPARPPARHRPRALRGRHRRARRSRPFARWRAWRASSRRSRPPMRSPGCWPSREGELDLVCLSGRGDKDLAEVLAEAGR